MSLKFLYLNEPDMIKAGVMDMKKCVQSMDDMFQVMGQGDYLMGSPSENHHGMMLWFPEERRSEKMPVAGPDRRFMAMPAYAINFLMPKTMIIFCRRMSLLWLFCRNLPKTFWRLCQSII